ncbi:hypothetical protein HF086_010065 [Spodoptera exigua]|uniref:DNA recombination and repair protein Rad51-like C-terminal domain-containing protein n=1 Tax=Spodoptera exigua TaxID=7107 RepID=A0A922N059_SPOEX|nr:hypothetical protein HF086_010065 [Spodoptera exigua]
MASIKFKVESGVQLLARLTKKPVIENFYSNLFQPGLKQDDVVEIIGEEIPSNLLIDLITEALLPIKKNVEPIGVLLFNTIGKFNYEDLIITLKKRIGASEMEDHLQKALNNFFILDIYDTTQMYTTIHNLDNLLSKHHEISLLIFDNLTAFYWSEQGFKITKMDSYIRNLIKIIQKVIKEHKVIIIYTRPRHFSSNKDSGNPNIQFIDGVNYRVLVESNNSKSYNLIVRTNNLCYPKYMSLEDNQINWI